MLDNQPSIKDLYPEASPNHTIISLSRALAIGILLTACQPSEEAVGSGESNPTESSETGMDTTSTGITEPNPTTGQNHEMNSTNESGSSGEGTDSSQEPQTVCGNGIKEKGEECDQQDGCFNCYRDRIIFVSSNTLKGAQIAGLKGADDLCLQYAGQAGLSNPLSYQAWLSDSEHDAEDRLFISKGGRYFNTNGELIFIGWKELLSGELRNPVGFDEYGEPTTGSVWTGTLPNGVGAGNPVSDPKQYCDDWTSDELFDRGYIGSSTSKDSVWTYYPDVEINPSSCAFDFSLYCIEGKIEDKK